MSENKRKICSKCGKKPAEIYQIVHDDTFRKEIAFCGECFGECLGEGVVGIKKENLLKLYKRLELCEERVFDEYGFGKYTIDSISSPQIYFSQMYEDKFSTESATHYLLLSHINYYKKKLEKAVRENDYTLSEKLSRLIEKLKDYL